MLKIEWTDIITNDEVKVKVNFTLRQAAKTQKWGVEV